MVYPAILHFEDVGVWVCLQVVFEGIRGGGFLGDIALDDISQRDGYCEY